MNRNRLRLLAIGTLFIVALTLPAQQTPTASGSTDQHSAQSGVPPVEQHLKLLSEKLDLTDDQQAKVRPILQEMHDGMQKVMQDQSLSPEERHDQLKALHTKADKQAREILNDDQKKKLDQLEQQPHPELHGNPNT